MDAQQFDRYTQGLAQLAQENRQTSQHAAQRLDLTKLINKLIKQTVWCDGSSTSATRTWLEDIDLAFGRLGQDSVIEVATSTVTGPLRKEIERFLTELILRDNVARAAIPWAQVRAHVVTNFLNVDEAAALRDSVDQMRQSTYETDASFNRRFRDLADAAFPSPARNEDQHRIMIRAYARGLRSSTMAVKMIEQANPVTIEAALTWVTQFSGRQDAVTRLGLLRPGEEAMEIGTLGSSTAPRPPQSVSQSTLVEVLRGQERLMTKLAKMEATQNRSSNRHPPRLPRPGPRERLTDWTADGQPRCFACGVVGHMRRSCPTTRPSRQEGFRAQPASRHFPGNE